MDIKERAQLLADALVESSEYQRLKKAREDIEQHEAARIMLKDFQKKQMDLQKQQLEGKSVTESQVEELTKLYEILNINPYIRELFESEMFFHGIILEVQEILSSAIDLEPMDIDDEDENEAETNGSAKSLEEDIIQKTTKKIWTPGN
ncbi:MAG: YlbF family regulator [Firmicutes bacterium]|nr:YlbF family regulator [Bacillota bacterium]